MVQLRLLSGSQAGFSWETRRFPVRIGRAPDADLQLEEPGVWSRHARLSLQPGAGFVLGAESAAAVLVNGEPVTEARLRNGDTIELGAVKLRFWLTPTEQRNQRLREWLAWAGIALVSLGQVALVYWLLRRG